MHGDLIVYFSETTKLRLLIVFTTLAGIPTATLYGGMLYATKTFKKNDGDTALYLSEYYARKLLTIMFFDNIIKTYSSLSQ